MDELLENIIRQAVGERGEQAWRSGGSSQIVEALKSDDEERQLQGTVALCTELNMATPVTLTMMNTSAIVPSLLDCLHKEHNPELQLTAARALTYMSDSLPHTLEILSNGDNVKGLLAPVSAIQDVELAEQCLSCVEKLCQTASGASATFRCNGIGIMLAFVDFFTTSTQRKIWASIARMCKCVDCNSFGNVRDALPIMRANVQNEDAKICGKAISSLQRVTSSVRANPRMVDEVFNELPNILIAVVTRPETEEYTFSVALALIQVAVTFSDVAIRLVTESGLLTSLLNLLDNSTSALVAAGEDPMQALGGATFEDPASPLVGNDSVAGTAISSSVAGGRASVGSGGATTTTKRHALTFENTKQLCAILSTMVVPCRDGPFAYVHELIQLESKEAAAALSAPFRTHNGDEDDVEEEEECTDDEGDDSGADDEDDEEGESSKWEQLRERIRRTSGIHLRQTPEFMRFRNGNHSCDGCTKTCLLGNWYRCNDCRDVDFCGECLLQQYTMHGEGKHTFCDMKVLHDTVPAKARELSTVEKATLAMYRIHPELLAEVLRAVPKVVLLCTQSEASAIRAASMSFLLSAVNMASPSLLVASGISGPDVCEAIMAAITDTSSRLLNLYGVVLVSRLLGKLPEDYASTVVREGIAGALVQLQKRCAPGAAEGTSHASVGMQPLEKKVQSLQGWRSVIYEEIATVFANAPALKNTTRSILLDRLVSLLRADRMAEAAVALKEALMARKTAHEFAAQDVFHELNACLLRSGNNIEALLQFVVTLCESSGGSNGREAATNSGSQGPAASSSVLADLVHLLHTALSHLDQFAAPSFGPIASIHSRIPLELVPHKPDTSHLSSFPKGPASATAAQKKKREKKGGNEEEEPDDAAGNRPSVRVNIEPLASVGAICGFISRNLLNQSSNPRAMRAARDAGDDDGDGRVEDVLPELARASDGSRPKAKKTKAEESPDVWVRYEDQVLPLSMSMIQLLQTLVKPKSKTGSKHHTQQQQQQQQPQQQRSHNGGISEPIRLYYSTKPYGASYGMAKVFKEIPRSFDAGPKVVLPSQDARPGAVRRVLAQVHQPFTYSRSYLSQAQINILTLLGVLYEIVTNWSELLQFLGHSSSRAALNEEDEAVWSPPVKRSDFVHRKLNNKAMRHCSNLLLAGQHTSTWAVNLALDCNFLFAPATRKFMFEVSFCGTVRSLARMQQNLAKYGLRDSSSADHNSSRNIQLTREKKRVWRQYPLECAMELLGGARVSGGSAWEFEFYDEAGSGLGPTREFYTLVAKALRKRTVNLWRSAGESDDDPYFTPLTGLYPRPLPATGGNEAELEEMKRYFKFIGRFLGRALLDEHVASLPLSPVFLALFRGDTCNVDDIRAISRSVCDVLVAMIDAAKKETSVIQLPEQKRSYTVDSMALCFTLPGDDSIELMPGGANVEVTEDNMMDFCDAVTNYMLNLGVSYAVAALREGFNDYIPLMATRMLSVEEFSEAINGYTEPITRKEFEDNCSADHGFTLTCSHVQWLFDILASFSLDEQKRFFLFLTGSPHLPVGGLASLRPKLTIVRKTASEASVKETDQLPSAMTCQNYLKLPAYDSKQQMEDKLRQAITEGTGAFLLS